MWGSPLKPKKEKSGSTNKHQPNKETEKEIEKFKPEKLTLTKGETKKILDSKKPLSYHQIEWTQKWLETAIRENSYPPQLAGADAYGQILLFLNPTDSLNLLQKIRADFDKIQPPQQKTDDPFDYLQSVEMGAYHEHLPLPHTSSRSNQTQDDDLLL